MEKRYLSSVNYLRGIAAFAVCLFHFTNGNRFFLPANDPVKHAGSYLSYGVEVFFIISGLVIPLAMYNASYRLKDFKVFLWKRVVRIEPAYLASFLLVLGLNYLSSLSPFYRGKPFDPDPFWLLSHLGYLNSFYNVEWINPVYWTLAIEFQYYILIALMYPLLASRNTITWFLSIVAFNVISLFLENPNFVFQFSPYFSLGIIFFKYMAQAINRTVFALLVFSLLGVILLKFDFPAMVAASFPVVFIFVESGNRILKFMGDISYSLYLLHVPIGLRVINLSMNFQTGPVGKYLVILLAVIVTVFASYLFYRFVELPFKKASKKIRYRHVENYESPPLELKTV